METLALRLVDEAATRSFAAALAGILPPGLMVTLNGPLGAGKTTFVQGVAAALGVVGPVTSPTYVLVREYELPERTGTEAARLLVHADLYRLRPADVAELALDERVAEGAIVFVEWPEIAATPLADDLLALTIRPSSGSGRRGESRESRGSSQSHESIGTGRSRESNPSVGSYASDRSTTSLSVEDIAEDTWRDVTITAMGDAAREVVAALAKAIGHEPGASPRPITAADIAGARLGPSEDLSTAPGGDGGTQRMAP